MTSKTISTKNKEALAKDLEVLEPNEHRIYCKTDRQLHRLIKWLDLQCDFAGRFKSPKCTGYKITTGRRHNGTIVVLRNYQRNK